MHMFSQAVHMAAEPNPDFLDEVGAQVPDTSTPVTLMCNLGGHLDDYGPSPNGLQSRSVC